MDDPDVPPEEDDFYPGGNGQVCRDAVERGEFTFDFGNDWWCDKTGQITST
jgi:hypothetical protein